MSSGVHAPHGRPPSRNHPGVPPALGCGASTRLAVACHNRRTLAGGLHTARSLTAFRKVCSGARVCTGANSHRWGQPKSVKTGRQCTWPHEARILAHSLRVKREKASKHNTGQAVCQCARDPTPLTLRRSGNCNPNNRSAINTHVARNVMHEPPACTAHAAPWPPPLLKLQQPGAWPARLRPRPSRPQPQGAAARLLVPHASLAQHQRCGYLPGPLLLHDRVLHLQRRAQRSAAQRVSAAHNAVKQHAAPHVARHQGARAASVNAV